jgi:hypothetical protein
MKKFSILAALFAMVSATSCKKEAEYYDALDPKRLEGSRFYSVGSQTFSLRFDGQSQTIFNHNGKEATVPAVRVFKVKNYYISIGSIPRTIGIDFEKLPFGDDVELKRL